MSLELDVSLRALRGDAAMCALRVFVGGRFDCGILTDAAQDEEAEDDPPARPQQKGGNEDGSSGSGGSSSDSEWGAESPAQPKTRPGGRDSEGGSDSDARPHKQGPSSVCHDALFCLRQFYLQSCLPDCS